MFSNVLDLYLSVHFLSVFTTNLVSPNSLSKFILFFRVRRQALVRELMTKRKLKINILRLRKLDYRFDFNSYLISVIDLF